MTNWIIPALADCDPGIRPTEFQVLLALGEAPERSKGGVLLPDDAKDRENFRATHARLVAVSPHAFSYVREWTEPPPRAGDEVITTKFAGAEVVGRDGRTYRLASDRDIKAVVMTEGA